MYLNDNLPKPICLDCKFKINFFNVFWEIGKKRKTFEEFSLLFNNIKHCLKVHANNK